MYQRLAQVGGIPIPPLQLDGLFQVYHRTIIFLNIDLIAHILIMITNEFIK